MKMKKVILALTAAGLVSSQAFAEEAGVQDASGKHQPAVFTEADTSVLFQQSDSKPMQVASLSSAEMSETKGAFGPVGALVGGAGGLAGYTLNTMISGADWSPTNAAIAAGTGAAQGAVAGPMGVVWGFNGALAAGVAGGVASHYGY